MARHFADPKEPKSRRKQKQRCDKGKPKKAIAAALSGVSISNEGLSESVPYEENGFE